MAERAKHAFGSSENLQNALNSGVIDAYDILFLDGDTEPKIGWVDKDGVVRMVENGTDVDLSGIEAELATKANAKDVNEKIDQVALDSVETAKTYTDEKVEAAISEHLVKKYEITSVPEGTLVDYRDKEIRVMCPKDSVFTKQSVGAGGNPNNYYMTFKTYVYNDNIVGYKEHLGDQVDAEILTDLKTDKYGRRYQPTWLTLAEYDETTDAWTYRGASSNVDKYEGWDYQIDWFDANGVMIASDSVRINLSNEDCYSAIKPYYGVSTTEEIETKVEEVVVTRVEEVVVTKVEEVVEEKVTTKVEEAVTSANSYTDAKIAELEEAASYTIVEF